ncbi:MAG: hypothetical protein NT049_07720, partial [Planctomycetota bacterium]|nr:hypothetical protein [Planctomycetota bacterium]
MPRTKQIKRRSALACTILGALLLLAPLAAGAGAQSYSAYPSWDAMHAAADSKYAAVTCVSGTAGYTGFWFFGAEQFDATNRY